MITEKVYAVDWGLSIRHDDACDGAVSIDAGRSIGGMLQPVAKPPATITAKCSKCGSLEISHIAIYAFDADLANLADHVAKLAGAIDDNKDAERLVKVANAIRDRAAINTEYAHR